MRTSLRVSSQIQAEQVTFVTRRPNNAINTDVKHARALGAHVFAAGYGER